MWDVGKSDLPTSETEEGSDDEENDGSAFMFKGSESQTDRPVVLTISMARNRPT